MSERPVWARMQEPPRFLETSAEPTRLSLGHCICRDGTQADTSHVDLCRSTFLSVLTSVQRQSASAPELFVAMVCEPRVAELSLGGW